MYNGFFVCINIYYIHILNIYYNMSLSLSLAGTNNLQCSTELEQSCHTVDTNDDPQFNNKFEHEVMYQLEVHLKYLLNI